MGQSSIAVSKKSKEEWKKFKNYPSESMEKMINRILKNQKEEDEELLTQEDLAEIKRSKLEIKRGNFKTLEQIKSKYNIS